MRLSYKGDKKLNWLLMYLAGNYCDSDKSLMATLIFRHISPIHQRHRDIYQL